MSIIISGSDILKAGVLVGIVGASFMLSASFIKAANANPVNCATANKAAEFTVCNNEDLLVLDETLQTLHREKLAFAGTKPQQQAVKKERMRWVAKRNACGSNQRCLQVKYQTEIIDLKGNLLSFD